MKYEVRTVSVCQEEGKSTELEMNNMESQGVASQRGKPSLLEKHSFQALVSACFRTVVKNVKSKQLAYSVMFCTVSGCLRVSEKMKSRLGHVIYIINHVKFYTF